MTPDIPREPSHTDVIDQQMETTMTDLIRALLAQAILDSETATREQKAKAATYLDWFEARR